MDAVMDTRRWMRDNATNSIVDDRYGGFEDDELITSSPRDALAREWSNTEIVTELGAMLKLMGSECEASVCTAS